MPISLAAVGAGEGESLWEEEDNPSLEATLGLIRVEAGG